ncbi:unnamed protein product [Chilo suppressalis]|uniref:Kazal-like domain-containing protein n=1 Tax=Chilo suppressalis TaxID=168631 RepID=A0ABN8AW26_CHISP|nr:unnamed protein product [Chilo suppressalis]
MRQRDTPSRFKKKAQEESSTYHEDKKGPQKNEHYDPSYGFEPYWTGGDWALNKFAEQHKTNGSKYLCEDTRRQLNLTEFLEDRKREQVTVQPSAYGGPKRNKFYDPNYGYEIYWADGNWVLEWFHKFQRKNESSCDEKCVAMHYKYGKVCGRNKRFESRTFDDMCQMRHFDCADDDGWVPVYRGECRPDLKVITTLPSSTVTPLPFPSMADIYVAEFEARHPHLSNY